MHTRFLPALLILILLFIPATIRGSPPEDQPVRIGLTLGLTGKYAAMAGMQMKGFRIWQEHVNRRGGLLGRRVELVVFDDQGSAEMARTLYQRLIVEERVDLVFDPYSSGHTAAVAPLLERYGFPLITSGASADSLWDQGYTVLFGLYTPASRYTVGFLELLLLNGIDRLALLGADDPFSRNIHDGTRVWARRLGLDITIDSTFVTGTEDLRPLVSQVQESGAEAFIVCGYFEETVKVRSAMAEISWKPKAFYASVGPVLKEYSSTLGGLAEGTFSSTQWEYHAGLNFPGTHTFNQTFLEKYAMEPSYHAATAYAAGEILEKAVNRAGTLDRARIREVLSRMDAISIIGRYGVDNKGQQNKHFPLIIQWQSGKKEIVWPKDLATSEPLFE